MTVRTIEHLIAGGGAGTPPSGGARSGDVFDPNSGEIQARVTLGTQADLDRAVAAAQKAQLDVAQKMLGAASMEGAMKAAQDVAEANAKAWETWMGMWGVRK